MNAFNSAPSKGLMLSLEHVGVAYSSPRGLSRRPFWALRDVSLQLKEGQTLGVIGRNGAGKSTLLKLLAGIIAPDRGVIVRKENTTASLLALQVGFMPQLTGRENAIMSCILLGLRHKEAKRRVNGIFAYAEVEAAIDKPVATYSAGMRARLGFGVAMEADPDILLIDEVLGVGDAEFREKSSQLLKARINSGRSAVIVSHDVNTLSRLCDCLTVIEDGCTALDGDVDDVLEAYKSGVARAATVEKHSLVSAGQS